MSNKLYQIGSWAFSHRWKVLAIWLLTMGALAAMAINFTKPYDPRISIPGTEAQEAIDKLAKEIPAASTGSGTIVFAAPDDATITSSRSAIERTLAEIAALDGVSRVVSPFMARTISPDGRIAFATVQLDKASMEVPDELKEEIAGVVEANRSETLQVEMKGDVIAMGGEQPPVGEILGLAVAALVLMVTFGSIVAAGMPLLIAIVTVGLSMLGISTATGFISITSTTPTLAVMLGLAVGIDYALFMLVRYIRYLQEGVKPNEAAGRTAATAGNAVIFAAVTVIIALTALSVVGIPFLRSMGIAAATAVAIAATAAVTLVPALLGFAKYKILPKGIRKAVVDGVATTSDHGPKKTLARRWVTMLTTRPIAVVFITILALGAVAYPATQIRLGLPDDSSAAADSTQRKAYDLLSSGFGEGFNAPLLIVADLPEGLTPTAAQGVLAGIATQLGDYDGVQQAIPAGISPSGRIGMVQAYPVTGPAATETKDLIERIRDKSATINGTDIPLAVTGSTAVAIDIDSKLADALPKYLAVVVGLSLIILLLAFRSILVPLKATAGFLLTIFATLGLLVGFFQWGWLGLVEAGPILSFLPILVTGILFGLAMDYQFFLVSGMHEEYSTNKEKDAKKAIVEGYVHGAKVVTIAAIIMIAVFAGFIFTDDTTIRSIGFALAAGVFIDAFIVRMTLVPAAMTLFGRSAWWIPKWLDKSLPHVSIEGSTEDELEEHEDLDRMHRTEVLLALVNDFNNIRRTARLENDDAVELSKALDGVLLTIGIEGRISGATLAKLHMITAGSASNYLKELVERGFVEHVPSLSGQPMYVQLSSKGLKAYGRILHRHYEKMNAFMASLDDTDVRSLAKIMRQMRERQ